MIGLIETRALEDDSGWIEDAANMIAAFGARG